MGDNVTLNMNSLQFHIFNRISPLNMNGFFSILLFISWTSTFTVININIADVVKRLFNHITLTESKTSKSLIPPSIVISVQQEMTKQTKPYTVYIWLKKLNVQKKLISLYSIPPRDQRLRQPQNVPCVCSLKAINGCQHTKYNSSSRKYNYFSYRSLNSRAAHSITIPLQTIILINIWRSRCTILTEPLPTTELPQLLCPQQQHICPLRER